MSAYTPRPITAPVLSGVSLRLVTRLLSGTLGGPLRRKTLEDVGIPEMTRVPLEEPPLRPVLTPAPSAFPKGPSRDANALAAEAVGLPRGGTGFRFETVADFVRAYESGTVTPVEVAERVIQATRSTQSTQSGDRPMNLFIAQREDDLRAQAEASAARWAAGEPRSVLDGVPVPVKDEVDQVPYPTTVGTTFLGTVPASEDAETVARLRAAGALLIGKTNMHEIGIGVTGQNPHHGVCRNPYDPARHSGGSSSGSAASVGCGLAPIGLGADGGGSIRTPAGLCGLVGLKPTYGRVSEHGAAPLAWSVGHLGPIAATALDAAVMYAVLAGPDAKDPHTRDQPPVHLEGLGDTDLTGVRLGVFRDWYEDADAEVVAICDEMVEKLRGAGATLVDVEIPDLHHAAAAHLVLIASEMRASQERWFGEHASDYGLDVQVNLALAGDMTSVQYVAARRWRNRMARVWSEVMADVDGIVTPGNGTVAPPILEHLLPDGESNLPLLRRIFHFTTIANLTGFPAIAFPAGYDANGLPVPIAVNGRPWEEHLLLRIAHTAEGLLERRKPAVWHSLTR